MRIEGRAGNDQVGQRIKRVEIVLTSSHPVSIHLLLNSRVGNKYEKCKNLFQVEVLLNNLIEEYILAMVTIVKCNMHSIKWRIESYSLAYETAHIDSLNPKP